MKQVTIFVHDYPANKRMAITFGPGDFNILEYQWDKDDERLEALQVAPGFKGYRKFSQLRTEHFRVLLQRTMLVMESLSERERADSDNPAISTFNYLVLGMLRRMEDDTGLNFEMMRIHRVSEKEISFDVSASMDMNCPPPPPLKEEDGSPFTIIVDNTK